MGGGGETQHTQIPFSVILSKGLSHRTKKQIKSFMPPPSPLPYHPRAETRVLCGQHPLPQHLAFIPITTSSSPLEFQVCDNIQMTLSSPWLIWTYRTCIFQKWSQYLPSHMLILGCDPGTLPIGRRSVASPLESRWASGYRGGNAL